MSAPLTFDFRKRFARGPEIHAALTHPLEAGRVLVLFGPSGSGKTTVFRCLAGLDPPDSGFIRFGDEPWFESGRHDLPPQARRVGLLFQDYALFPHLSVLENVEYGLDRANALERSRRVSELIGSLGLQGLETRRPGALSGGQKQRVALARALAPRPRLLLLDEPLSALDAPARESLRGELRSLLKGAGAPVVVVTHDRIEALSLGDDVAVLAEGSIRQVGPVADVFSAPADLVVATVVGTENVVAGVIERRADGLAEVKVGEARITAVDPGGASTVWVCIRAEDVILEASRGTPTSARNLLQGTVAAVVPEGPLVRVTLDCGFWLVALVTRQSVESLGVAPGKPVAALVKATAIRLVPRHGGSPVST